jgi:hypothetical protein
MSGMPVSIVCGDTERHSIQISDDGDHVGTVQYSLTESSCIEVSNLSSGIKIQTSIRQTVVYVLCDGLQGISDVAQLFKEQKNQSHDHSKKCFQIPDLIYANRGFMNACSAGHWLRGQG